MLTRKLIPQVQKMMAQTTPPFAAAESGPAVGSGIATATRLVQVEDCCHIIGHGGLPGRYLAGGCRPCRIFARWTIAGRYYCTRHAKARGAIFPNTEVCNAKERP